MRKRPTRKTAKRKKSGFRKTWIAIIAFATILLSFILANYYILAPKRKVSEGEITTAVEESLVFLNHLYDPEYLFNDPYIFDYNTSDIVTYRKLDMSIILVHFLPEKLKIQIPQIISDAEKVLSDQLEIWKNASIQTQALDLYAALAYYYPKGASYIVNELIDGINENGDWVPYYFRGEEFEWRKITDESWPIIALAKHNVNRILMKKLLDRKAYEMNEIFNEDWHWPKGYGDYYAVLCTYHVFLWVKKEGYDIEGYRPLIRKMEEFLAQQPFDEYLQKWTVLTADTLYWLIEGNYQAEQLIHEIAMKVFSRQEKDGGWRLHTLKVGDETPMGTLITEENYEAGTAPATLMAILALESYKNKYF